MNKIFKQISLGCLVAGLFISTSSCNRFDEINTNPDTTATVSASLLATNVILTNLQFQGRDAKAYLSDDALSKYIAYGNETIMPTQYNSVDQTSFGPMTLLPNTAAMVQQAAGSPMLNSYKALAKFSEAYMFYYLTMEVGDIPFSQAGEGGSGNITPKYDSQENVFIGILNDLKEADQLFAQGVPFAGDPTPYNGDPDKWRRATNSFALKVLMSLSKKTSDANLNVKGRFQDLINENVLLTPTTGYLGLQYSVTNPHPLSGTNNLFTSRTMVSQQLVNVLKSLNDNRLYYFADPALSQLSGTVTDSNPNAYVGAPVTLDYNTLTANLLNNDYSLINSRYLKVQAGDPRIAVSYAEQQLILAEASILGWINTGSAQNYYQTGVQAALTNYLSVDPQYVHSHQITQAYINNYFTGAAAFASNPTDQLHQIWTQKWLLQYMQDAISAFFEQRRTGYPVWPIDPTTSLNSNNPNGLPLRWLYPQDEKDHNTANLQDALNSQYNGADDINGVMWLLK